MVHSIAYFQSLAKHAVLFLLSMIPFVESKAAIPAAAAMRIPWRQALLWTAMGNAVPIPFVLKYGGKWIKKLERFSFYQKIYNKVQAAMHKNSNALSKNAVKALAVLIAIPFTGIGAWGGSFIANFLDLDKKQAFIAIFLGVTVSCFTTTLLTYGLAQVLYAMFHG